MEKKRGRPPKPEGRKLQRTIQFDAENLEWLDERAEYNGWSISMEINRLIKKQREQNDNGDKGNV